MAKRTRSSWFKLVLYLAVLLVRSPTTCDCAIRELASKVNEVNYQDLPREIATDQLPKFRILWQNNGHIESSPHLLLNSHKHNLRRYEKEIEIAESSSFPNVQPGSFSDELLSQWYVLKKSGKAKKKDLEEVESIFKRAKKSSVPHTYSELVHKDKVQASLVHTRKKRHVFSLIDSRKKITDTTSYPFSSLVSIKARGCTGYFVGPRHILTAAHCIYNVTSGTWFKDLNFYREKNCDPDKGKSYKWVKALVPVGYKDFKHPAYDFAMIITHKKSPSKMNFGWTDDPSELSSVHIAGYPSDKPGLCMWESSCEIEDKWSSLLGHKCDTAGGNSGSPVFKYSKGAATAYCIHRGHIGIMNESGQRNSHEHYNVCSQITKQRFLLFSEWIARY